MRKILQPRVLIGALVGLIALYALVGFILLPYLIKSYVVPTVSEQIKHPILLRDAAFNPFALSVRLTGLEVQEQNETPMLGFEELFVNVSAASLFLQKMAFDEIHLTMPFVAAKVNSDGKLNLMSLVPPEDEKAQPSPQPAGEPKKLMPVQIDLLDIGKGIIEYRDDSKPRPVVIDVVPFGIVLRNFSTVQVEGSENAHAFTAEIGKNGKISWEGNIFLEPLESDGQLNVSGIRLKVLYQAVQEQFQFDVNQGDLGLSASYHFDLRGQTPQVTVKNGKVSIDDLTIVERGGIDPVVTVPVFNVEGIQLDLHQQTIDVAKVHSADARFDVWMAPNGVVNYQTLFTPVGGKETTGPPSSTNAKPEKPAKPWTITVDEVGLKNYHASYEDRTLAKPAHVDIDAMNLTVKDVQIPFKKPLPVDLSLKLNETGSIGVKGTVTVEPVTADADLKLEHIEIRPFQPYLDQFLNADVRDGAIDLDGAVHFAKEHANAPMVQFQGNLGVGQLAVAEKNVLTDAVAWKALNINRIVLDVEPTAVKIAEIVWQEPSAQIVIGSDGTLNFSRLAVSSPPTDQAPAQKKPGGDQPQTKPAEPVPVTIDQVKLVKLAATFEDQSIDPKVKTGLTDFGGTIKGLSSKQLKKADVNLAGKVGRTAPFKIVGKINPLSEDAFTDVVITLAGMDLRPGGPYSGKYVGYGLSKGKLSLDLKYKVSQKILEAENLVHVDQLTFGEKTNSPDATSLPVPLVVGLLKDRKGQIEIDMPIRGNLNDPDFKYGKVVISTLLNLLTKVVASPFSLMGKLVPGGGEDEEGLQFIEFQPGSASLTDEDMKKLEALETALDERAGLRLDVKGTFDTTLDRTALQTRKLHEQLLEMSGKSRGATGDTLSSRDEQRLIEKLYAKLPSPDSTMTESTQPTIEEMKQRVAAAITISDAELEALARQRGEAVRDLLLESGRLTDQRVVLLDSGAAESGHEKVRTQLALAAGS
ncbi:DUF748 domain-containing protein [Nitrospira sp. BLG_1]|uniref:DUF748 domain-containing protein n=1 Tax=Nitrospira sp. BLG_1 TaxID=3395883 RepID=UPI0039BC7E94